MPSPGERARQSLIGRLERTAGNRDAGKEAREVRKAAERLGKENCYSMIVSGLRSRSDQDDRA